MVSGALCAGGITNNAYIFFVGMLMAQFTFTGYDACALTCSLLCCKTSKYISCTDTIPVPTMRVHEAMTHAPSHSFA